MRVDAFECAPVFVYASSDCGCGIMRELARSSLGVFLFWSQEVWICPSARLALDVYVSHSCVLAKIFLV